MKGSREKMRGYATAVRQWYKSVGNFFQKLPLEFLGWLFLLVPLAVYVVYVWHTSCISVSLEGILPVGLFMAFGAQLVAAGRYADTQRQKREQFFLESFVDAYTEALGFLKASDNDRADRVAWVAAGRAVASANGLAAEITEMSFRHVLEIHRLKCLPDFSVFLEKPAHFYYGTPTDITDLDEAAKRSIRRESSRITDTSVPPEAIRPIWAAVQWTKDFENECQKMQKHLKKRDDPAQPGKIPPSEPLKGQGLSEEMEASVFIRYPELYRYLCHKLNFVPRKPQK